MAAAVCGHIGSKTLYQEMANGSRWSSCLANPHDVATASQTRKRVEAFKKCYLATAEFFDKMSLGHVCARHLGGILPAAALLARRYDLASLFTQALKPTIAFSFAINSYQGPAYWFCGGFLKDLAKQRYYAIAARAILEPSSWAATAIFLASCTSSFGRLSGSKLEKLAFCGFVASFALSAIQNVLDARRYDKKAARGRSQWFDSNNRLALEGKIGKYVNKGNRGNMTSTEYAVKAVSLAVLRIAGFKNPLAIILIEIVPLIATCFRYKFYGRQQQNGAAV